MGSLELAGRRRGRGPRLALALCVAAATAAAAGHAASAPVVEVVRCLDRCAGQRAVAAGGMLRFSGRGLAHTSEVRFHGDPPIPVAPTASGARYVRAPVPAGAADGKPALIDAGGDATRAPFVKIVPATRVPEGFAPEGSRVRPHKAFFDGRHPVRLRFRFAAPGVSDLRIRAIHDGHVVRRWTRDGVLPYSARAIRWSGARRDGSAAPGGRYHFRVGAAGERLYGAGAFRLYGFEFPVRGPHGYGGSLQRFGAPRSGGRIHQGQDVFAACGTREVAARGGRVQARGSDPVLYGNWVVIDGRGTRADYRYAHLLRPTPLHDGERVRTGQGIGRVGRTGNARTVGCMLHFELWPEGWGRGAPTDPLPRLRRWDRYS